MIAGVVTSLGASLALLIRIPYNPENVMFLTLMVIVSFDCTLMLIFSMRGLAEVYEEPRRCLERIQSNLVKVVKKGERRSMQQLIRSCCSIKTKFGGKNFVDMLTSLNCISHAAQLSVQIPLLSRSR